MENFKVLGSYEDLQLIKTIAEHYGWKYDEDFCAFSPNFSKGNCLVFITDEGHTLGSGYFSLYTSGVDFKGFDAVKELLPATVMIREAIKRILIPEHKLEEVKSVWPKYFQWTKEDAGFWKNGHCYKIEQEGACLMRATNHKGEALTSIYTLDTLLEINEESYNIWLNTWKEKSDYPKYVRFQHRLDSREKTEFWQPQHCYKVIKAVDNFFVFENYEGRSQTAGMSYLESITKEEYDKFVEDIKWPEYDKFVEDIKWPEYIKLIDLGEDRIKAYNGKILKKTIKSEAKSWYGCPNPIVFYTNANGVLFGLAKYSKIEKSTKEEFNATFKTEFMFGGRKWEIKDGVATHYFENGGGSYKITLEEVQASIKFISSIPESNGYPFTFDDGHTGIELKTFLVEQCNIGFGCCRGTFAKALEFEALLNKSKIK